MKLGAHKNVIECLDTFNEENTYYIVMPYVPLNLADVIYNTAVPVSMRIVKCIIRQILTGVNYLHM